MRLSYPPAQKPFFEHYRESGRGLADEYMASANLHMLSKEGFASDIINPETRDRSDILMGDGEAQAMRKAALYTALLMSFGHELSKGRDVRSVVSDFVGDDAIAGVSNNLRSHALKENIVASEILSETGRFHVNLNSMRDVNLLMQIAAVALEIGDIKPSEALAPKFREAMVATGYAFDDDPEVLAKIADMGVQDLPHYLVEGQRADFEMNLFGAESRFKLQSIDLDAVAEGRDYAL